MKYAHQSTYSYSERLDTFNLGYDVLLDCLYNSNSRNGEQLNNFCRDAALYALGIGACSTDAVDSKELKYVYHQDGQQSIEVLNEHTILSLILKRNH